MPTSLPFPSHLDFVRFDGRLVEMSVYRIDGFLVTLDELPAPSPDYQELIEEIGWRDLSGGETRWQAAIDWKPPVLEAPDAVSVAVHITRPDRGATLRACRTLCAELARHDGQGDDLPVTVWEKPRLISAADPFMIATSGWIAEIGDVDVWCTGSRLAAVRRRVDDLSGRA